MSPTGGIVFRKTGGPPPTPGDTLVFPDDFTNLGAYAVPDGGGDDYAYGFYLRREPTDGNQVHLGTAGFIPKALWSGTQTVKLQMRGSAIKLFVDNVEVASVVDTDITAAGKSGVYGYLVSYSLDNFLATNAGGGTIASDAFIDANGTLLSAHGTHWHLHPSYTDTLQIQSNTVQYTSGGTGNAVYYNDQSPANADYDVELPLTLIGSNGAAGVVGRVNTLTNTMYYGYYYYPLASWVIGKIVNGGYFNLAIAPSPSGAVGIAANVYEWRDITPTLPADPTNPSSYSFAPIVKVWGNIYGPAPSKRQMLYGGQQIDYSNGNAWTQPFASLFWDPIDSLLYWTFAETYSSDTGTWYLGYSELNYSTGESIAHGSWTTDAIQFKGGLTGFCNIPASFITAAGLGTKRLGVIGSPAASVHAAGDISVGPSVTAFIPPTSSAELTSLASKRIAGYPWAFSPTPGYNRALRPASIPWYQGPGSAIVAPYSNWSDSYWWEYDVSNAGVWIHGSVKSGFITLQSFVKGQVTYLHASNMPQMTVSAISIMSEADMLACATGAVSISDIQPTTSLLDFAVLDPADYTSTKLCDISTVTSVNGDSRTIGAVVTTAVPHGLGAPGATGVIGVIGTSAAEYNDNWDFIVINSTQIRISNPSLDVFTFYGNTATGGALWFVGYGLYPGMGIRILGLAYDEVDKKMYLGFIHKSGIVMVNVWQVNVD